VKEIAAMPDSSDAITPPPEVPNEATSAPTDEVKGADQFVENGRTEDLLRAEGFTPELKVVAIADIDLAQLEGGDSEYQMRDQIVDMLVAQRYGDDLGWGTRFPAGVLSKGRGGSGFEVVDFHHRIAGARRAGFTHVSAYVVPRMKATDRILLGFKLNRDHGKSLTDGERVREAVTLLRLGHFTTVRQAARVLGTDEQRVSKAKRIVDAQQRAMETGISPTGWSHLGKNSQERLGSIEAPGVFREATNKVLEQGLPHVKVNEMVTAINAAPSEAEKVEVVRNFGLAEDAPPTPVRGLADAWNRCHLAARNLLGVDDNDVVVSLRRRTIADAQQMLSELADVSDKVEALSSLVRARLSSIDDATG
jgi:ParB-like chromosome segregation protein Spo0J